MFANRRQAGQLLADKLKQLFENPSKENCLVIALPRGGVPVASEVARALNLPMDILVAKKIRAPDNPELAIGAVSSYGIVVLDEQIMQVMGYPEDYKLAQQQQKEKLIQETKELENKWLAQAGLTIRPKVAGKTVILVDDGVATGATTLAAIKTLDQIGAKRVILAVPVAPSDTAKKLAQYCDVVLLDAPYDFGAVGLFYKDFHQVEDKEMIESFKAGLAVTEGISKV